MIPVVSGSLRGVAHDTDGRRTALHRLRRAHPRTPDGDARLRARRVARPDLAHRDRRRRPRVAALQRQPHSVEHAGAGGHRGDERRGGRPGPQRADALHGGAPGGLQRQGPPPGHGRGRHRPRGAVPDEHARPPGQPRRRVRRGAGARLQRLGVRPHPRRRGAPVRGGRGAADARRRRRRRGGRRDPARRRAAGHGLAVPAPEPGGRVAAVQRPGLRPDLGRRGGHRSAARLPPVPRARPARVRARA